jgi:hypothetical protein
VPHSGRPNRAFAEPNRTEPNHRFVPNRTNRTEPNQTTTSETASIFHKLVRFGSVWFGRPVQNEPPNRTEVWLTTSATGRHNHPVPVDNRPYLNLTSLNIALKQFDKLKCPGPDGFRPIIFCHLPLWARQALINIYNAVIELHYTPLLWRGSEIIFWTKPGKDNYIDKRACRPISPMPFLFKALERMVKRHMEEHANAFHPHQHAFRKGHSTENAL